MRNLSRTVPVLARSTARSRALVLLSALAALAATSALAAAGVSASSGTAKQVGVADDVFKPLKVKLKAGQQVTWVWASANLDAHNVTLLNGPSGVTKKQFKSKTHARNYTFTRKFTVVGKYVFLCTIHPSMGMTVVVKK